MLLKMFKCLLKGMFTPPALLQLCEKALSILTDITKTCFAFLIHVEGEMSDVRELD